MYKRPILQRPEKPHKLQENWGVLGQIDTSNDPGWIHQHLVDLMNDGCFALSQFQAAVTTARDQNMSDYKKEVADAKRAELLLKGKRALMSFLKKHIDKYRSEVTAVENAILRITEPETPSDPMAQMVLDQRRREIRDNLKKIDPRNRRDVIAGSLERLQAVISNPDPLDVIVDPDALVELRRDFAFRQDPTLRNMEEDQKIIYRSVRARAGQISATANLMLIHGKLDDPLPPAEFYETFPPRSEHEAVIVKNIIRRYEAKQDKIAQDKEWDEKNEGVNLGRQERVERLKKGIPH